MNNIYQKVDPIYQKIYNLLKIKPLSEFTESELNTFKSYYEELFKCLAPFIGIDTNIEFNYTYTGNKEKYNSNLICAGYSNEIYINLDSYICLQKDLIETKEYDLDLFVSQMILTAAYHELVHLKQNKELKEGTITLENYLISKQTYIENILHKHIINYYETLSEGEAHFWSICFTIEFLNQTNRKKENLKLLKDCWTWNHIFAFYYSKFPFSCHKGQILNNDKISHEIIKNNCNRHMLRMCKVLDLELNPDGSYKHILLILDKYFYSKDEKEQYELLKIYSHILFKFIDDIKPKDLFEEMKKRYGKEETIIFFESLYNVLERMVNEYSLCYRKIKKILKNPSFNINYLNEYDMNFNEKILLEKYLDSLNDIKIKRNYIIEILRLSKKLQK